MMMKFQRPHISLDSNNEVSETIQISVRHHTEIYQKRKQTNKYSLVLAG